MRVFWGKSLLLMMCLSIPVSCAKLSLIQPEFHSVVSLALISRFWHNVKCVRSNFSVFLTRRALVQVGMLQTTDAVPPHGSPPFLSAMCSLKENGRCGAYNFCVSSLCCWYSGECPGMGLQDPPDMPTWGWVISWGLLSPLFFMLNLLGLKLAG
jgi:hypothetical protein